MSYITEHYGTPGSVSAVSEARIETIYARVEGTVRILSVAYGAVASAAASVVGWLERSQRARKTAHVLRGLSDGQLADIGIYRVEIGLVSRNCVRDRIGHRTT